jgi:hypothetical protein
VLRPPNSSPLFQMLMLPSSPWTPYSPLMGAMSESITIRCGFGSTCE